MGTLARVGLIDLVRHHSLDTVVETGTGHGHSVIAALKVPELIDIRSIELDYETFHRAQVIFAAEPSVKLYHGDSVELLSDIAVDLNWLSRKVLWFLDAHFAGSGKLEPQPMVVKDAATDVPIEQEFQTLRDFRDLDNDVIVIDDLCLFEYGPFDVDAPELREALKLPPLTWLEDELRSTHSIHRSYRDGGYFIARPLV